MLRLQPSRSRLSRSFRLRPAPALNQWFPIVSAPTLEVPTLPLGTRMLATSNRAARKRGPKISSIFKLRTLRPERLEAVGQEVIDLSRKMHPSVPTLDGHSLQFVYECEVGAEGYSRIHYPEGTRGVFYFHRPSKGPELCAGMRFRICESAAEFKSGRDLLGTRGNVWGPKLLELVKHKELKPFLALCHAEQLIDDALIADIEKLDISNIVRYYHYCLSDPFHLDLDLHKNAFRAVPHIHFFPLAGTIKVQFELSNLPEHKKLGPTLVVRVLDIVDPVVRHPLYDGAPPMPVPGTLLQRVLRGRLRVVAIPLQRQPMAEDLLALAKTTWP